MNPAVRLVKKNWKLIVAGAVVLLAGVGAGWLLHTPSAPIYHSVRDTSDGYQLIAPFLYLEVPESTLPAYQSMKDDLSGIVNKAISDKTAADVGVYVRDMNTGQWVAINADHKFALASMLKVVTVMTVLHEAELHPDTLAGSVTIAPGSQNKAAPQAYVAPANPVQPGHTYTLSQLFDQDLAQSDNGAEDALEAFIGLDAVKATYADLNLPVPPSTTTDTDTSQQYSHLFRVLYGATYLSRTNSEALLSLLSHTNYKDGLVAGVPAGTTIAHKFGENYVPASASPDAPVWHELHDCGIVYAPKNPYFVCVTTKGDDFPTLANIIKDISAQTWSDMRKIDG